MMVVIPQRLRNPNYRFVLIRKGEKAPFEMEWQDKNNYRYDAPKLLKHLAHGGNYGIVGGYGNLLLVDFDDKEVYTKVIDKLPDSFTVKSGGGFPHIYFKSKDIKTESFKILDKNKETLIDMQGSGKQLVAPDSTHPNGKKYEVLKDIHIAEIDYSELKAVFEPWLEEKQKPQIKKVQKPDKLVEDIKRHVKVSDLLSDFGIDTRKNPTGCPLHSSKGGKCLSYDDSKEVWHCFHCNEAGDVFTLYMLKHSCDFKEAIRELAKKAGLEQEYEKKQQQFQKKQQKKKKGNKEDNKPIMRAQLVFENELWEQVMNDGRPMFAVWNGEKVEYKDSYTDGDEVIVPISDQTLREGAVILPSRAEEYGSTKELLEEIRGFIHKYLDISKEMKHISSWYVLLSWLYDRLRTLSYLRARGDTGRGKTRFLETIGSLCYHCTKAAGCVTPAPIYRLIRLWRGTIILDEGDFKGSDESHEVVKILNCGFQKDMPVIRCNKNDPDKLEILPTFCPKIIATRQSFTDKALESRCLTEIMKKTNRDDIPVDLPLEFFEEADKIRNKLLMFRFKNYHKIDPYVGINIEFGEKIEPRIKQAMVSFPVIFQNDKDAMKDFKDFVKQHQKDVIEERAESFDGVMVNALAELIIEGLEVPDDCEQKKLEEFGKKLSEVIITSKSIAENMVMGDKPVSSRVVGKHLKSLKIGTKPKKVEKKTVRSVDLSDKNNLMSVFQSYISDKELLNKVTSVTLVTSAGGENPECNPKEPEKLHQGRSPNGDVTNETNVTKNNEGYNEKNNVTDETNVTKEGEEEVVESNQEFLLRSIRELDKGQGVDISELENRIKWGSDKFEGILKMLKTNGEIFENKPGRVKPL